MALSGMITFGLCVVLIDCLNGQITHPDPVVFKASGRAARVQCKVDSSTLRSSVIHWYRAPPKGALQRLMYFEAGSPKATKDPDTPRRFSGSVSGDVVALTISKLEPSDEGSYYCALWSGDKKTFGSGTKLYVTEQGKDKIKAPTLYGYRPSKKDEKKSDKHGKQTMLCQASGMFPDLVKFAWKKKDAGNWADAEGDIVEQRNDGQEVTVTSMLIVDKDKARNNDYQCTVVHEGKTEELEMKRENSKPAEESKDDDQTAPTCTPLNTEEPIKMQISGDSEQIPSMFLFVYAYGVMLMKNGLFFCVVSIFLLQRKAGKKDKSSET